jgi:hypothetical protein
MDLKRSCVGAVLLCIFLPAGASRGQSSEGSAFDQSKFVPDIAFILDVSGVTRNLNDQKYYSLTIPGFSFPFLNQPSSSSLNAHRGMNFNYGELSLSSVVDPYFDLFAVLGLAPESAGLEEAYFSTRKLPYGLKLKAGKFLASFGRINEQHEHFWDFANRPLIATALFGEDGLNEIGAQATWVAPTPYFLVLGAEVLNGSNEQSFGTTAFADPSGAASTGAVQGPNLYIGFIRASFDAGDASILLGLSNAAGKTHSDQGFSSSAAGGAAVDAKTDIVGADVTVKYTLDAIRWISFQGEYMHRAMSGTEYAYDNSRAVLRPSLDKHHSGFYVQSVMKLDQQWACGARYDLLMQNDVSIGGADQHMPSDLPRYSAMIEYNPTEFSRFRLQFDRDESLFVPVPAGLSAQPYTQIILQANLTIGAHGAHAF